MRTPTKRGLQVIRRVFEFLAKIEVTAALGPVTKQAAALGAVVERLEAHAVEQDESHRAVKAGSRESQRLARALRKEYMQPVSRQGLALFPHDEALREALAMPKARDYEGLITAAQAMAGRVEPHKALFVEKGFEGDFIERLRNAVEAVRESLNEKERRRGRRSAATAGMLEELAQGRKLVRLLDSMVAPRFEDSPNRLAEWRTIARFARVTKVEDEAVPAPPVTAPVGPAPGTTLPLPGGPASAPAGAISPNTPPIAGGDVVEKRVA
jgi:hypothetical protein